ncbi:hypothetical protein J4G37_61610, partial [Microvirga sp. 3-52]|nr:hypothetical protein [Microvirga sp. 3-52]
VTKFSQHHQVKVTLQNLPFKKLTTRLKTKHAVQTCTSLCKSWVKKNLSGLYNSAYFGHIERKTAFLCISFFGLRTMP